MKVGSLVKCITDQCKFNTMLPVDVAPEKTIVYTVWDIIYDQDEYPGIRLEEIVNPKKQYPHPVTGSMRLCECTFNAKNFREVQPPMDVSALIEDLLKLSNENSIS